MLVEDVMMMFGEVFPWLGLKFRRTLYQDVHHV